MLLHPKGALKLLLLAAVASSATLGVNGIAQSGNSQAALDNVTKSQSSASSSSLLTAPAELVPVSSENLRFSRLLKDTANVLQFSSISNDAPPIWGVQDSKKDGKTEKAKSNSIPASNFGRRALDYDESHSFDEPSETKIVANPYPGNEYVYVRPGKLEQDTDDSHVAASVTSINNKPPRVPLALLRQKKGKRVNISPLFTQVPEVQEQDALTKEFVWVDQPAEQFAAVNRQGRKHQEIDDATTNPAFQEEDLIEATTLPEEILPIETTTTKQKMIVNVVTSAPRFSVESEVSEKKGKQSSRQRSRSTTTSTTTTAAAADTTTTTTETVSEATSTSTTTSTTTPPTTTSELPTTPITPLTSSSSTPKAVDEKENLVADASHRSATSFHGFEDSQAKLQTAESSQPARVNVRPAQNGKEYEYEYIYYYYDDDDDNSTEKHAEPSVKAVGQKQDVIKQGGSQSSSASLTSTAPANSPSTPASSSTTTTVAPQLTSDTDFDYEEDAALEEEGKEPELQKSTPAATRTTEEPIVKGVSSAEKLSNANPINQLDRSRGPKIFQSEKFEEAAADYKLETEASQEDEVTQTHVRSKGQPLRQPATSSSEEEEQAVDAPQQVSREPSTSAPAGGSTSFDFAHMPTLAKNHKDSINTPIVLKQSSLLKAVPASQFQHQVELTGEQPSTSPFTTPSTTTTVEAASEPAAPVRPVSPRLRGQRLRGSVTPRASTTTTTTAAPEQQPAEEKPTHSVRRPNLRDSSSRRHPIPNRRPTQETAENAAAPEQTPAASPIIESHARPLPIRPRFPPRTGASTTTTTIATAVDGSAPEVSAAPVAASAAEINSLEDKRAKDTHVRAKSANDLYAFTRLQQAISSRAPSRIPPKLVAGFVNSAEVTTDAMTSSEVTTVSSFGGQSSETVSEEPTSTTSTTTTTTTEAVQLDKYGRQRNRFGGRTRKPLGGGAAAATTTTETPAVTTRSRFNGRRRSSSTTEAPEGTAQQSVAPSTDSESPKPRLPTRNRFASRNRGSSTTEATPTTAEGQKVTEAEKPSSPTVSQPPRRRPGAFQGRRRANQLQAQTEAPATQEETASTSSNDAGTSAVTATSTAAPATPENAGGRTRFNFGAGGRARPGAPAAAPGNNPVRIRGGGRLRGPTTTTTTTEAAVVENEQAEAQEQPADAEQSPTIQSENIEQPLPPASEGVTPPRGGGGVLGRLKSRPKLVVTTTTPAPEAAHADRKPSRLNGILNRRKNLGQLTAAAHVKEEVRETTSEVAEEASNHAQEQTDEDHKGVVVQISSSVTESEEVNDAHAEEVAEPSSTTTPGSILNRLKSHRKPGSLFRKKPDPHGE